MTDLAESGPNGGEGFESLSPPAAAGAVSSPAAARLAKRQKTPFPLSRLKRFTKTPSRPRRSAADGMPEIF